MKAISKKCLQNLQTMLWCAQFLSTKCSYAFLFIRKIKYLYTEIFGIVCWQYQSPITSLIDIDLLQQDLNLLLNWCGVWLLSLSFTKCKHMSIGPKSTSSRYLDNEAHPICVVQEEKDLDVHLWWTFTF